MIRASLLTASFASIVAAHIPSTRAAASATSCLGNDLYGRNILRSLKVIATSSETTFVVLRETAQIPLVLDTAVVAVSDSRKCASATTTYNSKMGSRTVADVYLFRVGKVFVASNPSGATGSEFTQQLVMDSSFTYLGYFLR